ncbi:MAG: hypothetical protein PHG58_08370 [Clostridia bacterium]|nr:hypothetical protein [Clostridia bacterium]
MRLFHVSEESDISIFTPRIPDRSDLDKTTGLVWAIDENRLPNFLTPRNCPRVAYHICKNTNELDRERFFSSSQNHAIVIEGKWYQTLKSTTLYLYELETDLFELQDDIAGYYISKEEQKPIEKFVIDDLLGELISRNVEIRIVDNLWTIADEVKDSTLNWSLCRMAFAQPRL